ncbi:MAG: hypothetical protein LUD69_07870 [Oscillospiraceae bacterium]|nr:hypothetical protein [Oscillospiraceae bacterium]
MSAKKKTAESNSPAEKTRRERVIEGMAIWASYYRENIDAFLDDYLGLTFLKPFQKALLAMMNRESEFVWIAARGMGKTFLIAIFVCVRAILYPGSLIVITAGNRGQSINVLEKVQTILIPKSPALKNEIDLNATKFGGQDAKIMFKNTSVIKVVTANDGARSNRANILIVDEFRQVKKDTVDTVLKKFLTSRRMPQYIELTEEERAAEYAKERNKQFFLSSAYFKDSWAYRKTIDTANAMIADPDNVFCVGLPYQLSIQEGLLFEEDLQGDMRESDFSEIKWSMEMGAEFFGVGDGSFFDFDSISKNRHIKYPMLPDKYAALVGYDKRVKIPAKQPGEVRILSADIALMRSGKNKNDATAIFINQMLPTKAKRYSNNIVYTEVCEGLRTDDQALVIRKLFDEFNCDYLVIDAQGVGLGCYDALARDMTDLETGEVYPALSCCNNQEMAARCSVPGAPKVIWSIKASAQFNSDCAYMLREAFRNGRIRLLCNEFDAHSELLPEIKAYTSLSEENKVKVELPYINTTLLVNELIQLQHEEVGNRVKVFEKVGMRKDRYSSLAYNYYVATQVANKLGRRQRGSSSDASFFIIKPPSYSEGRKVSAGGRRNEPGWY